jgi:hypothetical protein
VTIHTDLTQTSDSDTRYVGRVEVAGELVVVSDPRIDRLHELVLVPRFDRRNGAPISLTEEPHAYLRQVAEDLEGGIGLGATALHGDESCQFTGKPLDEDEPIV